MITNTQQSLYEHSKGNHAKKSVCLFCTNYGTCHMCMIYGVLKALLLTMHACNGLTAINMTQTNQSMTVLNQIFRLQLMQSIWDFIMFLPQASRSRSLTVVILVVLETICESVSVYTWSKKLDGPFTLHAKNENRLNLRHRNTLSKRYRMFRHSLELVRVYPLSHIRVSMLWYKAILFNLASNQDTY